MEQKKSHFHDYGHAVQYDRRAERSEIRAQLAVKLVETLELKGDEQVLDLATGTGRFARPVARQLKTGKIVGVDEALAMLRVSWEQGGQEAILRYLQIAGDAQSLPFSAGVFDRAFVAFSLHHFGHPLVMAEEILRVLKGGGRFVVVDPVLVEARDSVDSSLDDRINRVFRRTHGENFRFHSTQSIQGLLAKAGFQMVRADPQTFPFDQDGMEGIPTGRHWLEVAEELQEESLELAQRFKENYFRWERKGERVHVKGSFSYALICGEKS